ncbi:MOSC domain-containing protein [Spirilliplanes yamanashiensis]|uniref:MOSC domain-containing protein n=1 Tax=Spirilliplanes yamanashiensis TaxID=42233 RepID=A0A8J4DLI2_9ACTN|nr:MOSC domain-containing protein [Spirilliplanes yamanashiensis]MDP9816499.1 MOSC domain-containing protein YiiM [Spirilliplanes yamanashiensis]GIJ06026.1 MOSC domain-containing protein [Spirilliplanes yamanashiensis]
MPDLDAAAGPTAVPAAGTAAVASGLPSAGLPSAGLPPAGTIGEAVAEPGVEPGVAFTGPAVVVAVCRDGEHRFSKAVADEITLLAGLGVEGDAHLGRTVQHRSRVAADPTQPNLRQVHLLHAELFDELRTKGFDVAAGQLGENVTTRGIDLHGLPRGTVLRLGPDAVVEITGLRNPCLQIEQFRSGLLKEVVGRADDGAVIRRGGIMGVVRSGGRIRPGDPIVVDLPPEPHEPLDRV